MHCTSTALTLISCYTNVLAKSQSGWGWKRSLEVILPNPRCLSGETAKNNCILQSKHVICKKVFKIYTSWNNLINTVFLNISSQINCLQIDHFGYTWTIRFFSTVIFGVLGCVSLNTIYVLFIRVILILAHNALYCRSLWMLLPLKLIPSYILQKKESRSERSENN